MPSRKVTSVLIICSALVAMIMMVSSKKESSDSNLKSIVAISGKSPQVNVDDNPNWQADISSISKGVSLPQEATTTEETLTDAFSRSFIANYLDLKQSGKLDAANTKALLDKSLAFINQTDTKRLELKDIIMSPDNSKVSLSKYGDEVGRILRLNKPANGAQNELDLYKKMLETKDASYKPKIQDVSRVYTNLANSLSKIVVPSTLAQRHLDGVNALYAISGAVSDLSFGLEDPIKSLSAVGAYKQSFETLSESSRLIKVDMVKAGVNYKQGENGYYFYFGI